MESKQTFGAYICRCRKERGLTQREFADKLYITESAVSKWERGLSYPDVTLLRDICAILEISEHELLTASEDVEARNADNLAKKYLRLAWSVKLIQFIVYGGAAVICFISNLAAEHTLSWFWLVLTGELIAASLTLVPVLAPARKGLWTMGCFLVALELTLLAACLYSGGDWFLLATAAILFSYGAVFLPVVLRGVLPEGLALSRHKVILYLAIESGLLVLLLWVSAWWSGEGWFPLPVLPGVLYGLAFVWGIAAIFRYAPINGWLKTAGCLGLCTTLMLTLNAVLDRLDGSTEPGRVHGLGYRFDFSNWADPWVCSENINAIVTLSLAGAAVLCLVIGITFYLRSCASARK